MRRSLELGGPVPPAPLPWSLETTRHSYKINIESIEKEKIDVIAKIRCPHGKKDEPLQ